MTNDTKTNGPASYFPAIEKSMGSPSAIGWSCSKPSMPRSTWKGSPGLKTEHRMGHGHASALVAYYAAMKKSD